MQTAKKITSSKTANINSAITKLNLSAFADKLKNVEIKEKQKKDTLYIYPEAFTEKMISGQEGKKHRSKLRNKIQFFENNIFVFTKTNNEEKLIAIVNEFNTFYKVNYRLNDYSVNSLSQSPKETNKDSLKTMLEIVTAITNNSAKTETKTISKTKKK